MTEKRPILYNLEALRGICALMVALVHVPWTSHFLLLPVVNNAWLFVDFFFVLSGFIIALNYAERDGGVFQLRSFMLRRFFRLYPLHVVMLLALLAVEVAREIVLPAFTSLPARGALGDGFGYPFLLNLLLLHGLGPTTVHILNTPSWSISTEFWTYLLFALCCSVWRRLSSRVLAMLGLGVAAFGALLLLNGENGLATPIQYGWPRCIAGFSLGTGVWFVWRALPPMQPRRLLDVAYLAIAPAVFCLMYFTTRTTPFNFVMLPVFAAIILLFAIDSGSITRRLLETKPMQALGRWSYSIYMVHAFWSAAFGFTMNRFFTGATSVPGMGNRLDVPLPLGDLVTCIYVALVIATSAITYRLVEKPWRAYGVRLSNTAQSRAAKVGSVGLQALQERGRS